MLAGGAASLIGGILGGQAQRSGQDEAAKYQQQMLQRLNAIDLPDTEKMKLYLEQLQSVGELDPRLEQAMQMGPSAMEQVQTDPRLAQTQMQNLDALQQIAQSGGFDPTVKADLNQAIRRMQQSSTAQGQAIQQQAQTRGISDSGVALAQQLLNSQSSANQAADIGEKLAAQAYSNRRGALTDASTLATQLRQQGFSEGEAKAKASDMINQFNTSMKADVQQRNVGSQNQAQAANLAAKQDIASRNVGLRNQQQQYNKELYQQKFDNERAKAGAMNQVTGGMANAAVNRGAGDAGMYAGVANAISGGIGTYQQNQMMKDYLAKK